MVTELAQAVDQTLPGWISEHVDFATSMVDRITPATTEDDRASWPRARGYVDAAPVPTEPFTRVGHRRPFPAGRPRWEDAGARIVDDVTPFEQRKLWLLNGSHSLLAYAGSIRGHDTIDEAIADPACRRWVEACGRGQPHLPLPAEDVAAYRAALLDRYANPRIRHRLAQIVPDGSTKLRSGSLPVLRAERAAGRVPLGCATAIAGWVLHLRGNGAPIKDPGAEAARAAANAVDLPAAVSGVLDTLSGSLSSDRELVETIVAQTEVITAD